jgi:hypothetical protein
VSGVMIGNSTWDCIAADNSVCRRWPCAPGLLDRGAHLRWRRTDRTGSPPATQSSSPRSRR